MDFLFTALGLNEGEDVPELVEDQQQNGQQEFTRLLPPLSKSIHFLDGKLAGAPVYYATLPSAIDWKDGKKINEVVPLLKEFGARQVPQCLLLDAVSEMDKLVVTNWWRGLTKDGQSTEIEGMRRVYKSYTLSNEKLTNDYWVNVSQSIESIPAAAALVDDTSNVYVGMADATELREAGMECTVSAKVAKPKKRKRKMSDPPTSPSHIFDKTARTALTQMENAVLKVNNVTEKPKDATFKGGLKCFSVVIRDTGTPQANGKLAKNNRHRKKPKIELYGIREGILEDIGNPVTSLLETFVAAAEQFCDVQVVNHGQEPPTQSFNRSRRRTKTKTVDEVNAELDVHVASGLINGGTFPLGFF
jgi:hypothetical protein